VLRLPSLGEMDRGMAARIFLCVMPADMRKGFDSLAAVVRDYLGQDPLSRDLFLFVGRNKDRIKILHWDGDGFLLWYKRLEEGTFRWPSAKSAGASLPSLELKASELAMLLEGIDLTRIKRRRRFTYPVQKK
jgi:transposase